ncbi:MAG TPA: hypothetical protein VFC85_09425, partial [Verrucomicrobiae bacterium]|nr:hypothetical protein [Verrucomicrobiae bacterium]
TIADFQRFLLAWQHVAPENQMEGVAGVEAILHLLDGYELPASAWEPAVLAARVKDYDPRWLDQLCFSGRIGWGRLSPPQNQNSHAFAPLRSSPIALFARENLSSWLELAAQPQKKFSGETELVLQTLAENGALFFGEIVQRTKLLQSRVEQALGELAAHGWVTADSFEGLRALLTPPEKRAPFGDVGRPRRHRAVTSIEFAGRWSLLRKVAAQNFSEENIFAQQGAADLQSAENNKNAAFPSADKMSAALSQNLQNVNSQNRDDALETFAKTLLRRYGIVFRKILEREALKVSWFELGKIYRRLEARGEIRGGYFVNGVSGEQFALPEAIGLLRSIRKTKASGDLVTLSAADPLNLVGILTQGARIASVWRNRILWRDGVPLAGLEAGKILNLNGAEDLNGYERALKIGKLPVALRRYY